MKVISDPILALCAVISLTLVLWQHFHPADDLDAGCDPTLVARLEEHEDGLPGVLDRGVRFFIGQTDLFD